MRSVLPGQELEWLTTTLALLGKFGAASAFSLLFLYTAELCPSGMRVMGVGMASACSRIGSVLAPVIADLGDDTATLPLCIFGVCGLLAGGMTAFLPETSGRDLPTTVAEAADFGRDQAWLPIPCLVARRRRRRSSLTGHDG
ncbi:solute carrier family 22 member 21-like, partial [Pollicipes pollicipes]|uniref:solute carrier family 22 member 21-like n=1 Tax=Pollicipes pollicipes TaxID=41117 RepID=UPI00188491C1